MIAAPLAMSAAAPPISITRPSGVRKNGCRRIIGVARRSPLAVSERTRRPAGEARNARLWSAPRSMASPNASSSWPRSAVALTNGPYLRGPLIKRAEGLDVRGAVPDAANRLDQPLVGGAELRAEPADVDVDRPRAAVEVVPPDLPEQRRPGEDPAPAFGEVPQQLELLERQIQRRALDAHPIRAGVERDRPEPDRGLLHRPRSPPRDGEPQADLALGGAREQHLVRDLFPVESLDVAAFDHRQDGDPRIAFAERAEHDVPLAGVLGRIHQHRVGAELECDSCDHHREVL